MKYHSILFSLLIATIISPSYIISFTEQGSTEETRESIFFNAARDGDISTIEECITHNVIDINARDKQGNNALHIACQHGHADMVTLLLNGQMQPGWIYGVPYAIAIDAQNNTGDTPAHLAARNGHEEVIQRLLQGNKITTSLFDYAKPTVDIQNNSGDTPIHCAAEHGYNSIVEQLMQEQIEKGTFVTTSRCAEINKQNNNGDTALHRAAYKGYNAIINTLLQHKADLDRTNAAGLSPIYVAAQESKNETVFFLEKKGANILTKDGKQQSLLHIAFATNNIELAQAFATNTQMLNSRNEQGHTPLTFAISLQKLPMIQIALHNNANTQLANADGSKPLHLAAKTKNKAIIDLIVQSGANINEQDNVGNTIIRKLINDKDRQQLLTFIQLGADINIADYSGITPFHAAVTQNNFEYADILLAHKALVNVPDNNGNTALHNSAINNNLSQCEYLLTKGADPKKQNKTGRTTFAIIMDGKNNDVLFEHIALHKQFDVNEIDANGQTALIRAAKNNNTHTITRLLNIGAHTSIQDKQGNTALHAIAAQNNVNCATMLISHDKNILALCNNNNDIPLHIALDNKQETMALSLIEHGSPINVINNNNVTPLIHAINNNCINAANKLINFSSINHQDNDGNTALHRAVHKFLDSLTCNLINANANLHIQNKIGNNPLHIACIYKNITGMKHILEKDSSLINKLNQQGNAPIHLTITNENFDATSILLDRGAHTNIRNLADEVPLIIAAKKNNISIAKLLLHHNASIMMQDDQGFTAFTHAIVKDFVPMLELLYENGAFIRHCSFGGNSPFHIAAASGSINALKYLNKLNLSHNEHNHNNETPLMLGAKHNKIDVIRFFLTETAAPTVRELDDAITYASSHYNPVVYQELQRYKNQITAQAQNTTVQAQREYAQIAQIYNTIDILRQGNKQLLLKINAKTLPNQPLTIYTPSAFFTPSESTITNMDSRGRIDLLKTVTGYQTTESNAKTRLEQKLQELERMEKEALEKKSTQKAPVFQGECDICYDTKPVSNIPCSNAQCSATKYICTQCLNSHIKASGKHECPWCRGNLRV